MKDYREMAENVLRRRDAYRIRKRKNIRTATLVLSCICVIAVLGMGGWHSGILTGDNSEQVKDIQPEDNIITDTSDETKCMPAEQEAKLSAIKDASADINDLDLTKSDNSGINDDGTAKSDNSSTVKHTGTETTIDVPVSDIPGDTGALTACDDVWGGCYMDENGHWVVWLTEDTPENRQKVFNLNPTLGEDSTIFKTAAYSKAYLTDLLARISNAMVAGKLPFVTTAALREDKNCVEVTTIFDDPSSIDQILAFDTLGNDILDSAIEIIYDSESHVILNLIEELEH